jgi:WD40 repeat protein
MCGNIKKITAAAAIFAVMIFIHPVSAFADTSVNIPLINSFQGQSDTITTMSISPDGNIIASGSKDESVKLTFLNNLGKTVIINAHKSPISKVVFSPSGKLLATASTDGAIKVWDSNSGELIKNLVPHKAAVNSLIFGTDDSVLYSSSDDGTIRAYDTETWYINKIIDLKSPVESLALNKYNGLMAALTNNNSITFIDTKTGLIKQKIDDITDENFHVKNIIFNPDYKYLVCTGTGLVQPVILYSKDDYKKANTEDGSFKYEGLENWNDCSFTEDGNYIIDSDKTNGQINIFNVYSGKLINKIEMNPSCIAVSKSNIAAANVLDNINLYEIKALPKMELQSISASISNGTLVKGKPSYIEVNAKYSDGTERTIDSSEADLNISGIKTYENKGIIVPLEIGKASISVSYCSANYNFMINSVGDDTPAKDINAMALNDKGIYAAVNSGRLLAASSDGVTWKDANLCSLNKLSYMVYGYGIFVAAGDYGTVMISKDGIIWTPVDNFTDEDFTNLTYDGNYFTLYGDKAIYESLNGLKWTQR